MPDSTLSQELKQPKLLDEVHQYPRLHHYSIHTERSYVDWIVRFIRFHRMRSRDDLFPAEPKIEVFLTHLAVEGNVASATQNKAMNALVFLYKRVPGQSMEGSTNAVHADKKVNAPVVMTCDEVAAILSLLEGTPQLVAKLLYGSGLQIMEAVRLRVKEVDFQMKQLTVRSGKGDKTASPPFRPPWLPCFKPTSREPKLSTGKTWLRAPAKSIFLTRLPANTPRHHARHPHRRNNPEKLTRRSF